MRVALLALAIALAAILGAPAQAAPQSVTTPTSAPAETIDLADHRADQRTGVLSVSVTKTDRPGRLRVSNPNDTWVRFLWGTFRRAKPDGRKRIDAYRTVTIRVHRHRIDWIALLEGSGSQVAGQGSVRGIRL
jgi:hypothetical protein